MPVCPMRMNEEGNLVSLKRIDVDTRRTCKPLAGLEATSFLLLDYNASNWTIMLKNLFGGFDYFVLLAIMVRSVIQ